MKVEWKIHICGRSAREARIRFCMAYLVTVTCADFSKKCKQRFYDTNYIKPKETGGNACGNGHAISKLTYKPSKMENDPGFLKVYTYFFKGLRATCVELSDCV